MALAPDPPATGPAKDEMSSEPSPSDSGASSPEEQSPRQGAQEELDAVANWYVQKLIASRIAGLTEARKESLGGPESERIDLEIAALRRQSKQGIGRGLRKSRWNWYGGP